MNSPRCTNGFLPLSVSYSSQWVQTPGPSTSSTLREWWVPDLGAEGLLFVYEGQDLPPRSPSGSIRYYVSSHRFPVVVGSLVGVVETKSSGLIYLIWRKVKPSNRRCITIPSLFFLHLFRRPPSPLRGRGRVRGFRVDRKEDPNWY